jgi:hypothetical protein
MLNVNVESEILNDVGESSPMRKMFRLVLCIGLAVTAGQVRLSEAGVVIKVRALNPLETRESVILHYPLPAEITQNDILKQKITYSLDHSEDEEPPKAQFKVSYDEEEKVYFIDDEVTLLPREVVTLEVHVKDVWVIEEERIEALRREVEALFDQWALPEDEDAPEEERSSSNGGMGGEGDEPQGEEGKEAEGGADETKETALMMKGEILNSLDKILARQEENGILKVGVERHMAAYNDNIRDMLQVRQDIALLTELIQYGSPEADEEEVQDGGAEPPSEPEAAEEHIELEVIDLDGDLSGGHDHKDQEPVVQRNKSF